ncbi:unnamed protein product [Diatraea saccharalis]|uniref:Uncharacterized protein n=1 Tax=Diatraea saccharalis TaxID=40085 RepID=A0A9N9R626_9NEOP|nr:unnamed protein product [Diatraea saccharalis]
MSKKYCCVPGCAGSERPSTIPKFTFSAHSCMKDVHNIEKHNKPSTSKASCGLFGMDIDDEAMEMVQSTASISEKSVSKENMRHYDDAQMEISDLFFERPCSSTDCSLFP